MGLAGPRKRAKINNDPNNTAWTRSEGFGHNMLVLQGWSPGQTLGAKNATHAHTYTAGSHSHVRAILRDDNLGLGAKRASDLNGTESTGLDAFQGILGRLNGKSDDAIAKEQKYRDDARRTIYAEQKWGSLRFVKGGTLHGEDISLHATPPLTKGTEADNVIPQSVSKKDPVSANSTSEKLVEIAEKQARKEDRRRRKAEKAERKLRRAKRKAAKVTALAVKHSPDHDPSLNEAGQGSSTGVHRPSQPPPSLPPPGRQTVRQRYIKQKRMAFSDAKALQEIFMVKA